MRSERMEAQGWVILLSTLVPVIFYQYLRDSPWDALLNEPGWHFGVVSAASIFAGAFAILVGITGITQRNVQLTFLSLAFTSLAILFTLHGLATPGFLLTASHVPGISSQLSVFITSIWLALSSLPSDNRVVAHLGRRLRPLVYSWISLLITVLVHGIAFPHKWTALHTELPIVTWTITGITLLLSVGAAIRYWHSYLYSRTPLPRAVTYACLWNAGAQWIITTGEIWRLSWWLYHFLLLGAVIALLVGVFGQYVRGGIAQYRSARPPPERSCRSSRRRPLTRGARSRPCDRGPGPLHSGT